MNKTEILTKTKSFILKFLISLAIVFLLDIFLYLVFARFLGSPTLNENLADYSRITFVYNISFLFIFFASIISLSFKAKKIESRILGYIFFVIIIIFLLLLHSLGSALDYSGPFLFSFLFVFKKSLIKKILNSLPNIVKCFLLIVGMLVVIDIFISLLLNPTIATDRNLYSVQNFETIMNFLLVTIPFILLNTIVSQKLTKRIKCSGIKKYILSNIILMMILLVHLIIFTIAHFGVNIRGVLG